MPEDRDQLMERVRQVKTRYEKTLLELANVVGVGIGLKEIDHQITDQVAIIVNVSQKLPLIQLDPNEVVPTELDGVLTDVQEVEEFSAFDLT